MQSIDIGKRILLDAIEGAGHGKEMVTVVIDGDGITIKPFKPPACYIARLRMAHEILLDECPVKEHAPHFTDIDRGGKPLRAGFGWVYMQSTLEKWMNVNSAESNQMLLDLQGEGLIELVREVSGGCGSWTEYAAVGQWNNREDT